MMRVSLAAAFFIVMSCIAANAMSFANRPWDSQTRLTSEARISFKFEDRPGIATKLRRTSLERLRVATVRPRLAWTGPMNIEQRRARHSFRDWPVLKPAVAASSPHWIRLLRRRLPVSPPVGDKFTFADRPGYAVKLARPIDVLTPLGFAQFCATQDGECSALNFARRRAILTPVKEEHLLLTSLSSFESLTLPHFRQTPKRWHVTVAPDHCLDAQPKRSYLECLGLPGELLKNKSDVASPLFTRAGLIPRGGGHYKLGKPYRVGGRLYRPQENPSYVQIGAASWYGADFHRRMTANGEWFDMEYLSAAHATLPLPCYAHVTNLENGKEMIVRINDRGPFVNGRIIDLSRRAAEILDFKKKGVAKVRVRYIGPAPLDDRGHQLATLNRELGLGTPVERIIAQARGLHQQAALTADGPRSFTE